MGSSEGWGCCFYAAWLCEIQREPFTSTVQSTVSAIMGSGPGENYLLFLLPCTVDLSSWREKIARDVAGATWGNGSGEEEEEEDGPAVLVGVLKSSNIFPGK